MGIQFERVQMGRKIIELEIDTVSVNQLSQPIAAIIPPAP